MKGFRFISLETLFQGGFRGYKRTDESDYVQKFPHYKQFPTEDVKQSQKLLFLFMEIPSQMYWKYQ